jgi:anaerobic ribonucleoside-triphosphate reductase
MKESTMKITIDNAERQQCEVWTRVMGYHRPVASFNTGKKSEHRQRRFFTVPDDIVYPC